MDGNQNSNQPFGSLNQLARWYDGAQVLTDSAYNRMIGLMLIYGFGVNALITYFTRVPILNMVYSNSGRFSTIFLLFLVAYFALCIGGNAVMRKAETTARCFLGYSMIVVPVGLVVSVGTSVYDPDLITRAMFLTCIVSAGMMLLGILRPDFFFRIGTSLGCALGVAIIVELVSSLIFRRSVTVLDWIIVVIMSLYVGYDWARANALQKTAHNAIVVSASLYLDIINIFLRILRILARSKRRD